MPATVAQLRGQVMIRVGRILADAGLYAPTVDGRVPVIDAGIARGAKAVGLLVSDPLAVSDEELAVLSPFAIQWVEDVATHYCLQQVLLGWYRVVQTYMEAVEPSRDDGGWLREQRQGVKDEVAMLGLMLKDGFRDTTGPVAVAHARSYGACLPPDAVLPGYYDTPRCEPGFFPYGYREWGCS